MSESSLELPVSFVTATCARHLLIIAESQIAWEDAVFAHAKAESEDYEFPKELDPNDSYIWRDFIYAPLLEVRDKGFESDIILAKGFIWLIDSIPHYISLDPTIPDTEKQELMALHEIYAQWRKAQQAAWQKLEKSTHT